MVEAPLAVEVGETVPQGAEAQDTVQATPWFAGSLLTVAVKAAVVPALTLSVGGLTETIRAETVTLPELEMLGLATDIATTVTAKSFVGGVVGEL